MEISDQLLTKALELFKRYGIRSVTMDEISGQCGISKKTIYQHFSDKDHLVKTSVQQMLGLVQQGCTRFAAASDNAIHEMFMAMDMIREIFSDVNPAMLYDLRKYHYTAYQELDAHKKNFMRGMVEQNLARGQQEGLYREDIKVPVMVELHNSLTSIIFEQDGFAKMPYGIADIQIEIITHYLYGLSTPKGAKLIDEYKHAQTKIN